MASLSYPNLKARAGEAFEANIVRTRILSIHNYFQLVLKPIGLLPL